MSPLTLYFFSPSPPARACLLLLRFLEIDVEVINVDLLAGDQRKPEYRKLNPRGKVPVLVDGDFVLSESRAILAYLVNLRKPGSDLYPEDPKKRALIDQQLYYDATVVNPTLSALVRPTLYDGVKVIPQKSKDAVRDLLKTLNDTLETRKHLAGDELTIADFSVLPTVTSFHEMGYNLNDYSNLIRWFNNLQSLPMFEENQAGGKLHADLMKNIVEGSLA